MSEEKWSLAGWLKAAKSADDLQLKLPIGYKTRVMYIQSPFVFYICILISNDIYNQLKNSDSYVWTSEVKEKPDFIPNLIDGYKIRLLPISNDA
jgi:hypothetical protein